MSQDGVFNYPDRFVFEWGGHAHKFHVHGGRVATFERYQTRRTTRQTHRLWRSGGYVKLGEYGDHETPMRGFKTKETVEAQSHVRGFLVDQNGRERPVALEVEVRAGHYVTTITTKNAQPVAQVNLSTEHWTMLCGAGLIEDLFGDAPQAGRAAGRDNLADRQSRPSTLAGMNTLKKLVRSECSRLKVAASTAAVLAIGVGVLLPLAGVVAGISAVVIAGVIAGAVRSCRRPGACDGSMRKAGLSETAKARAADEHAAAITGRLVLQFVDHHVTKRRA